jgi:hypothetical protein
MGLDKMTQKEKNMMPVSSISITLSTLPGFVISSPVSLQMVKATVRFLLLLFPILAFCIRALVYSVLFRSSEETCDHKSDKENLIVEYGGMTESWKLTKRWREIRLEASEWHMIVKFYQADVDAKEEMMRKEASMFSVTRSVSFHQSMFPYLVYYCHSVPKLKVYEAMLMCKSEFKSNQKWKSEN